MLPPRLERDPLRERDPPLRELRLVGPRDAFAAPLDRLALLFDAVDLRAAEERLDPAPEDLAREVEDFFAAPLDREPVEREPDADDLRGEDLRAEDLRAEDLREPLRDEDEDEPEPPLTTDSTSADHLPDSTRCAASATASAINEPSLVALAATLVAACWAVSAASRPASRIARRAFGLALIAAAAAASPAASISLLIAALASLSTVLLFELELAPELEREREDDDFEPDFEELLRADFAIASSPSVAGKTL
ncbi:MAG TPA: hypothetical protein VFW39_05490 [Sphingomicrobium sp.]|nr:hypothetical protein [Sphingomicrobium sp.]